MSTINIAIDGPAGAGKSTIAKSVAKELGYVYVDTGAMYRALGLYFLRNHIPAEDTEQIVKSLPEIDVTICYENGEQIVMLCGENVNGLIRTEEVGNMASRISPIPEVREKLRDLQRGLARKENVIMDGRDIGTTILPDARLKIFLTASPVVRAKRRYQELLERGVECDLNEIERDIIQRDEQDMSRAVSPLRRAEDAVLLDCSDMTVEETKNKIIALLAEA